MMTVLWALWLACLGEHPGAALHHTNLYNDRVPLRRASLRSNVGGATNEDSGLKVAKTKYAKHSSSTHRAFVPGEEEVKRQRQSPSSRKVPFVPGEGEEVQRPWKIPGKFAKWPYREELWPSMSGKSIAKRPRVRDKHDGVPLKDDQNGSSTAKRSRISEEHEVVPYENINKGDKSISVLRSRQMDDVNIIEEDKSSLLRSVQVLRQKHADRISRLRSKQEIKVHIDLTDDSIREFTGLSSARRNNAAGAQIGMRPMSHVG